MACGRSAPTLRSSPFSDTPRRVAARIVLVVTGKGNATARGRGVLRQAVPGWLARPDLRELVVGFEEAGRRHGGEGALYVGIRRRRAARLRSRCALTA